MRVNRSVENIIIGVYAIKNLINGKFYIGSSRNILNGFENFILIIFHNYKAYIFGLFLLWIAYAWARIITSTITWKD